MKTILFLVATLIISFSSANAQKTYELNELNQIPVLDEDNMRLIAFTLADLYQNIKNTPEKYSTDEAIKNTVYLFYDTDHDGILNKVNPRNGTRYSEDKISDKIKNDKLLFNLTFNEDGNLIVPEKIFVISYRTSQVGNSIEQIGFLAFELPVIEGVKEKLKSVRLENFAAVDKNSLTGELSPVKVQIPFNWSESNKYFNIDINIGRDMFYSSQPKSFLITSKK